MAGKIVLGFLVGRNYSPPAQYTNLCGRFGYRSYHLFEKVMPKNPNYKIHNSQVPTYEQVKNSPELQEELSKMYKSYAKDPDFHRITIESMKVGIRSLGREKH